MAGGILYGLVGVNHALQPDRSRIATIAMLSDLFVGAVLLCACVAAALTALR